MTGDSALGSVRIKDDPENEANVSGASATKTNQTKKACPPASKSSKEGSEGGRGDVDPVGAKKMDLDDSSEKRIESIVPRTDGEVPRILIDDDEEEEEDEEEEKVGKDRGDSGSGADDMFEALDHWAPVSLPYTRTNTSATLWRPVQCDEEEEDIYFLQLPTNLPELTSERLRTASHKFNDGDSAENRTTQPLPSSLTSSSVPGGGQGTGTKDGRGGSSDTISRGSYRASAAGSKDAHREINGTEVGEESVAASAPATRSLAPDMGVEQDVLHYLVGRRRQQVHERGQSTNDVGAGEHAIDTDNDDTPTGVTRHETDTWNPVPSRGITMPAGTGEHKMGSLGEISAGFFGTIKLHKSGRAVLHLGDSTYELGAGVGTSFAQQAVAVSTEQCVGRDEGNASVPSYTILGSVTKRIVGRVSAKDSMDSVEAFNTTGGDPALSLDIESSFGSPCIFNKATYDTTSPPFCPWDGTLMKVREYYVDGVHFQCPSCPYRHIVDKKWIVHVPTEKKELDDILGGEEAWKNMDQTEHKCKQCGNDKAYFMQIQLRSADEPMSIFFKCTACGAMDSER